MYLDLTIEEALKNDEFNKIIHAASAKYVKYIDPDDLKSLQMYTLWVCLNKYDDSFKMKFTTYLYTHTEYAIKNLIKKNKKTPKCYGENYLIDDDSRIKEIRASTGKDKIAKMLSEANEDDRELLVQRYYYNMTIKEIGDRNGYSKETARRKIQQALKKCSVLV